MTVSYAQALKDQRMTAVLTAIDAQSSYGYIEIGTAGMAALLVVITFSKPSFTEANSTLTMLGAPKTGTASAGGVAASARIKDSAGNIQVSGLTVGMSNSDIILSNTSIVNGQVVTLNSATITHSP
jgi:hypothetical protein